MISWLYTGRMRGRISVTGQSAGFCAVRAPGRAAEGGQTPAPHTAPILPHAAGARRELRRSVAVPARPKQGVTLYPLEATHGPCTILHGYSLTPVAKLIYAVADVASRDCSSCAMENTTLHPEIDHNTARHEISAASHSFFRF